VVRTGEINQLKVKNFLLKVGGIPKGYREPDALERSGLDFGDDPEEGSPARMEVLP
jgi:hypothetical protein